jgi:hypothetical protein
MLAVICCCVNIQTVKYVGLPRYGMTFKIDYLCKCSVITIFHKMALLFQTWRTDSQIVSGNPDEKWDYKYEVN